ncbi:hypothetical protein FHG66_10930 [Rubellimicrobium rubrum]|uniref:Uncharacterized protein n=1 Tax=Rubellimicrobium rubrum TaxID=2585369 RepID=A0A5C4MU76_9RHOB|nr:hypothetical protein [Rubellimicrobium rubrum]TNC49616.1 hypothetical protein FHG66_10930 [Rubellimicrobium rubrum]
MLDALQPWLPLLDDEPRADPPARKARRRPVAMPQVTAPAPQHRAARQAFLGVAAAWGLTAAEALRLLGEPVSHEAERLERLDGILGAHRSLRLISPEPALYGARLRQPEPAFDGASLLEVMLRDGLPGIAQVRTHLVARITR